MTTRIGDEVRATVRDAVAVPDLQPEARARGVLAALAEYFTADPRTVRVALMESLATEGFRRERRDLLEGFGSLAARLMRSLRADGTDDRSLETSAAVLTGGLVELLIAGSAEPFTPAALDRLLDRLTALYAAAAQL